MSDLPEVVEWFIYARVRWFFENMSDGLSVLEEALRYVYVNQAARAQQSRRFLR